jgi:alkylhydroperoxidase family enzyme
MTLTRTFRITPADPEALRQLEASGPDELRTHFELIRGGLEAIPGVPGDAVYGAVTLRTLALRPEVFTHLFLTEHHAAKQGTVDRSIKELASLLIAARVEGEETPACAPYHVGAAAFEGAGDEAIAIVQDFDRRKHELDPPIRDAVEFAARSAIDPRSITDRDVDRLREHGYDDGQLLELVATALVAYVLSAVNQVFDLREGEG